MTALLTRSLHFPSHTTKAKIVQPNSLRYFLSGNSVRVKNLPNTPTTTTTTTIFGIRPQSQEQKRRPFPAAAAAEKDQERTSSSIFMASSTAAEADHRQENPAIDERIPRIASAIRVIPDFPKPGIMFQDITTLLLDPQAFKDTIDLFVERYRDQNVNVVAGIEARGFIFGPPIALAIGAKFVPFRKPKKLPGEVISEEYSLEYGTDKMEMHVGAVQAGERALVVDDLIATGGTLSAAIRLLERVGVEVVECACVIELPELKGRDRLGNKPLFVLVNSN